MMKCKEFNDFLGEYLDGTLDEKQRSVFEAHMQICPPCFVYLDGYRDVVKVGKACCHQPDGELPPDVPQSLIDAILAARRAS